MTFLSLEFSIVFLVFFSLYWLVAKKAAHQNILLLGLSLLLMLSYSWYALAVLVGYSACVYGLACLSLHSDKIRQQTYLFIFLVILTFAIFRYYDAVSSFTNDIFQSIGLPALLPVLEVIVPIGLSFYIFHSISYIVAVQKKELRPVPFWQLLLYLSFFPSVISGPINRAVDTKQQRSLLGQLTSPEPRKLLFPKQAFWLILIAVLKLWVLSSYLGEHFVDPVFNSPAEKSATETLLAIYAYSFQIYFNFSGYSELVLAIGYLLGFQLPINFRFPYLARSIKEFWDRWHISLSLCIRDYIYIPLGGSQKGWVRTQINVFIAMVLSGIWHGVGLTFVIWGALHALGLILYNGYQLILQTQVAKLPQSKDSDWFKNLVARLLTFHFICFTWIFFRANSLETVDSLFISLWQGSWALLLNQALFWIVIVTITLYPLLVRCLTEIGDNIAKLSWPIIWILYLILFQCVVTIAPSGVPGFIYANF